MCSIPALVDHSPRILEVLGKVPVVSKVAEMVVRRTFFDQFVGGDTAHETLPVLRALRSANTGALFAYSVEVDEHEAHGDLADGVSKTDVSQRIVNEMIRCIDVADEFETGEVEGGGQKKTWVAVKITALLPNAASLINLSKHLLATRPTPSPPVPFPGLPDPSDLDVLTTSPYGNTFLTSDDITALKRLYGDLDRICKHAERKGVKVIIDAEYSWYQPALDALTFALMRKYNAIKEDEAKPGVTQPLIYATYQAYLRRTLPLLHHTLLHSQTHHYSLGIKLVRGAYHPTELSSHHRPLPPSPLIANPKSITIEVPPTEDIPDIHEEGPSISPDPEPPVWGEKGETDACYDACARVLVEAVARDSARVGGVDKHPAEGADRDGVGVGAMVGGEGEGKGGRKGQPGVGVLFGTHNWNSSNLILEEAVKHGMAHYVREEPGTGTGQGELATKAGEEVVQLSEALTERVTVAQLYGMGDALSEYMTRRTRSGAPFVIRYVPYGALSEVMPYLGRRAIENKGMLGDGGASEERRRAGREVRRRMRMWGGEP